MKLPAVRQARVATSSRCDDYGGMNFRASLGGLAILALIPVAGQSASGWSQLKAGMSRGEAAALLGSELMATRGRGFEIAIYDDRAEVVFLRGQVVSWTAPASSQAAAAPADAWQFEQVARTQTGNEGARRGLEKRAPEIRRAAILPAYRL